MKNTKNYILIRDGIYEVKMKEDIADDPADWRTIPNYKHIPNYAYWLKDFPYNMVSKDIIREGNSIEKLCDLFVGIVKSGDVIVQRVLAPSLKELKDSLKTELDGKTYKSKFDVIYGAVWFDYSLEFVTKMNDKGKFEPMKWYQEY